MHILPYKLRLHWEKRLLQCSNYGKAEVEESPGDNPQDPDMGNNTVTE